MYLLCSKSGKLEIFADYYKRFKMLEKNNKIDKTVYSKQYIEQIHDSFYYLLDTEMSLKSGCSNEFLQNCLYVIEQSWTSMESIVLSNLLTKWVLVMIISSPKSEKFTIPDTYLNFLNFYCEGNIKKIKDQIQI